ncbi:hypothetical protein B6V00_01765, partial [ANME-1 cluster archaeon ex4572_4]
EIAGGSREESARILQAVLSGSGTGTEAGEEEGGEEGGEEGARRAVVLLNAAAAIFAADEAGSLEEGFEVAREVLEEGRAAAKLKEFVEFSR